MAETTQKLLTVRMDENFLQQLRMATVARETTIAAVVRQGLKDWLSKNPARGAAAAKKAAKPAKAKEKASKSAAKSRSRAATAAKPKAKTATAASKKKTSTAAKKRK